MNNNNNNINNNMLNFSLTPQPPPETTAAAQGSGCSFSPRPVMPLHSDDSLCFFHPTTQLQDHHDEWRYNNAAAMDEDEDEQVVNGGHEGLKKLELDFMGCCYNSSSDPPPPPNSGSKLDTINGKAYPPHAPPPPPPPHQSVIINVNSPPETTTANIVQQLDTHDLLPWRSEDFTNPLHDHPTSMDQSYQIYMTNSPAATLDQPASFANPDHHHLNTNNNNNNNIVLAYDTSSIPFYGGATSSSGSSPDGYQSAVLPPHERQITTIQNPNDQDQRKRSPLIKQLGGKDLLHRPKSLDTMSVPATRTSQYRGVTRYIYFSSKLYLAI